jgi:pilus assembly protein CpaF
MFKLVVSEKGGPTKEIEFDKDEVTIGRVPGNDIILPGNNVSKRHSRVVRQDGRYFVVDLKSTNGTYLNGRRIMTPSPLRAGDKIFVGSFVVVLEAQDLGAAGDFGDELSDGPASLAEPLPLDQEPIESQPPPAADGGRPLFSNPLGSTGPRPTVVTQPLSTAPALAASLGLQGPPSTGNRSTGTHVSPSVPPRPLAPPAGPSAAAPAAEAPRPDAMRIPSGAPRPMAQTALGVGPAAPTRASLPGVAPRPAGSTAPPVAPQPAASSAPPSLGAVQPPAQSRAPTANWPSPARAPQTNLPVQSTPPPATEELDPPLAARAMTNPAQAPSAAVAPEPAPHRPPAASTLGSRKAVEPSPHAQRAASGHAATDNEYAALLAAVVLEAAGAGAIGAPHQLGGPNERARAQSVVDAIVHAREPLPGGWSPDRVARDAVAELVGAGAIERALEEQDVTSVLVTPAGRVLVGRRGAPGPSDLTFSSSAAVATAVDRLLHAAGAPRTADQRLIERALPDLPGMSGARMTAAFATGVSAPSVAIERPVARALTLGELVADRVLDSAASELLVSALGARRNVLIIGPRDSGRSTLLSALVAQLSSSERVVALEDRPELALAHRDVMTVPLSPDPARAIAVAHGLRPQRMAFTRVDDNVAASLMGLVVTGSEGILAVLEGPSGRAVLSRLAAVTGDRDEALERLHTTRPVIVQLARLGAAVRVVSIGEARAEGGRVGVEELLSLRIGRDVDSAALVATGATPSFAG